MQKQLVRRYLLLFAFLVAALPARPSAARDQYVISFTGIVTPWSDDGVVYVTFDGDGRQFPMTCSAEKKGRLTCVNSLLYTSPATARLDFNLRGFKSISRNVRIDSLNRIQDLLDIHGKPYSTQYSGHVDFGEIRLVRSEAPVVEQILRMRGKDKSHRFELTLRNPLKREVLVKSVHFSATFAGMSDRVCCCPLSAEFLISDEIHLTGGESDMVALKATLEEAKRSPGYLLDAVGTLNVDRCTFSKRLSFNFDTSLVLPALERLALVFVFPNRLRVEHGLGSLPGGRAIKKIKDISISEFQRYEFSLDTGQADELPVIGAYDVGRKDMESNMSERLLIRKKN